MRYAVRLPGLDVTHGGLAHSILGSDRPLEPRITPYRFSLDVRQLFGTPVPSPGVRLSNVHRVVAQMQMIGIHAVAHVAVMQNEGSDRDRPDEVPVGPPMRVLQGACATATYDPVPTGCCAHPEPARVRYHDPAQTGVSHLVHAEKVSRCIA